MAEQVNQMNEPNPAGIAGSAGAASVAAPGPINQVNQVPNKFKDFWVNLSPQLKKILVIGLIGLLAIAVALTVFLNLNASRFVPLYENMEPAESQEIFQIIQGMGEEVKMDQNGSVMVLKDRQDYLIAQMSIQKYPKSTLTYDIFGSSNGLTTTDYEKRELNKQQAQNRLQDTIRQYDGVKNAIVTLNLSQESNRVWETAAAKSTGSVSVFLEKGVTLSREQVSGIKYLVSSSVPNMQPTDVQVIDAATTLPLRSSEDDPSGVSGALERINFEEKVEQRLNEKTLNVLTLAYDPETIRVSSTVVIDYDKMVTESKEYKPVEDSPNLAGVLEHYDTASTTQSTTPAQGIVGEEDNTDLPTYVNNETDNGAFSDSSSSADYAVSYILQQIEKDQAELKSASIAVTLKFQQTKEGGDPEGLPDELLLESLTNSVSKATNIPPENISIEPLLVPYTEIVVPGGDGGIELWMLIAAGGVLLFLLLLIIILVLIGKRKKKKEMQMLEEAQAEAELVADQNAEFNLQQEFEERKRQLRQNAVSRNADDAITEEVREFARSNPEITANLLRAWMKEEID